MQDHFGKVVGRAKEIRHATDQALREWGQRADESRRPDQGSHRDEHHHLRQTQQCGYGLREQTGSHDEPKVPEYLFGLHHFGGV